MSDFRFAEPQFAYAIWIVVAFTLGLVALELRAARRASDLVSAILRIRLVSGPGVGQRVSRLVFLGAAAFFAVLALMRPQWGFEVVNAPRRSAELMVALDVSRSMLAEDAAPNRLERAKAEVRDLLEYLSGDQVGLIAFAGRAAVVTPMTPDFGFFRLVLDQVGPGSVGRGGTRLEEPVRKAIQGFKATGDVSRVLLLITDGEDHDSFPIEAAKDAAERGIRIIAIGFGSESGSEIPITDPKTGARTLLRDASGGIVQTRLDGDTLREMALLTDGVYVPAGTGALDLESIYLEHIAGLMRAEVEDAEQVVRAEGFQWAVLASLVALLVAALIGQGRQTNPSLALVLVAALFLVPVPARAQETAPTAEALARENSDEELAAPSVAGSTQPEIVDPRTSYNAGSRALEAGHYDGAQEQFEAARRHAGTDGEARYRATYGLGWAAAARADALLDSKPEEALAALNRASDHFREAVRLQPANDDPRHNLEIVLQRAAILVDTLARQDEAGIESMLDELIERQREHASALRGFLERRVGLADSTTLEEAERREFRALSTRQRQILSDADAFAMRVDAERTALASKSEEEQTPEEQIRIFQLERMQEYLQRARERMGHARRELRAAGGERASRRVAAALQQLKRARDQLRDPVQILDALVRDATELARYTQAMAVMGSKLPGVAAASTPPPWLTMTFLRESQVGTNERTGELQERFAAGLSQAAQSVPAEAQNEEEASQADQQTRILEQVAIAEPLVASGLQSFELAALALDTDDTPAAFRNQLEGLRLLVEAREAFLDLRRLIEVGTADQSRLQQVLAAFAAEQAPAGGEPLGSSEASEVAPSLLELQQRNLERSERIGELIEAERFSIPRESEIDAEDGGAEQAASALERLELASQILLLTQSSMTGVAGELARATEGADAAARLDAAVVPGRQALRGFENLRRIFFTIIEYLRDTAERQQELVDDTASAFTRPTPDNTPVLGPVVPRQADLAKTAGEIANVLEEQSRQDPGALVGGEPDADPEAQAMVEQAEKLRRAAEHTLFAQNEMEAVGEAFAASPPDPALSRTHQLASLEHLLAALAELVPPEQQEGEEEGEQGEDGQPQGAPPEPQPGEGQQDEKGQDLADPGQLLQEVRDREAQRQRDRARQQGRHQDTVEKDW